MLGQLPSESISNLRTAVASRSGQLDHSMEAVDMAVEYIGRSRSTPQN